ncbi:EboA domain-containing protein, partial [Streptomyces sp. NPDC017979]|uniref:EboA domain-containing protein n=1 Tax=Streptomyces sp. NPDC017979 TaxID=3365024 RepID=UPI003794B17F
MLTTREELFARLDAEGAAWLDSALAQARDAGRTRTEAPPGSGVPRWELLFSTAGRRCGPSPVVEAARVLMLHAARPDADAVTRLYERGTGAERRAVLLALPCLPLPPEAGVRLVEDALRTNDGRLVAAAVGPYAAAHLDAHAWR